VFRRRNNNALLLLDNNAKIGSDFKIMLLKKKFAVVNEFAHSVAEFIIYR